MRAHIIRNGKIVNTIVVSTLGDVPSEALIDADLHGGTIGDLWDGSAVTPKPVDAQQLAAEAERVAHRQLLLDAKATAMFDALKAASMTEIDAWVDANYSGMSVAQRRLLKLLAATASLFLRERG